MIPIEHKIMARTIDYLLPACTQNAIIGAEVRYANFRRRIDLLCIDNGALHAIEIKSAGDNFSRLTGQVADAARFFDMVSLCCEPNHERKALVVLSKQVGLLIYDRESDRILVRREARSIRPRKVDLATHLPRRTIDQLLGIRRRQASVDIQEISLRKTSEALLREKVIEHLSGRLEHRWNAFLRERGSRTHPDDLYSLTSQIHSREVRFRGEISSAE